MRRSPLAAGYCCKCGWFGGERSGRARVKCVGACVTRFGMTVLTVRISQLRILPGNPVEYGRARQVECADSCVDVQGEPLHDRRCVQVVRRRRAAAGCKPWFPGTPGRAAVFAGPRQCAARESSSGDLVAGATIRLRRAYAQLLFNSARGANRRYCRRNSPVRGRCVAAGTGGSVVRTTVRKRFPPKEAADPPDARLLLSALRDQSGWCVVQCR
jgi:hypothetical protein